MRDEHEGLVARLLPLPTSGREPGEPRVVQRRPPRPSSAGPFRRLTARPGAPLPKRAPFAPGRPSAGAPGRAAPLHGEGRLRGRTRSSEPRTVLESDGDGAGGAAAPRCRPGGSSWCKAAEVPRSRAALRSSSSPGTRPAGEAATAERTREHRLRGASRSSRRTWRPRAAMGATARQAGSPVCPGRRRSLCASSTTRRSMPAATACSVSRGRATRASSGHHRAPMDVEGIEVRAEVAGHVAEPLLVEKGEDLVVLAPQLAEPLHGQRVGSHDETALDATGAHEAIQDQAGLDGLAHSDLVGEQPAHRVLARGALGHVELVRVEANAASEEGAEARGLTKLEEPQGLQAIGELGRRVDVAPRQPLEEAAFEVDGPQVGARQLAAVDQPDPSVWKRLGHHGLVAGGRRPARVGPVRAPPARGPASRAPAAAASRPSETRPRPRAPRPPPPARVPARG